MVPGTVLLSLIFARVARPELTQDGRQQAGQPIAPLQDKAMEDYVSRHHQDVLRKAEAGDAEAQATLGSFFFQWGARSWPRAVL